MNRTVKKRQRYSMCRSFFKIFVTFFKRAVNIKEILLRKRTRTTENVTINNDGIIVRTRKKYTLFDNIVHKHHKKKNNNNSKVMADLTKKPKKGILKNSSSFDAPHDTNRRPSRSDKETKWDEMNIIATLHPPDKDYGHMKIEEPKTPYNYIDPDQIDVVDAKALAERIMAKSKDLPKVLQEEEESDESDDDLTPEAKQKKKQFEFKRKQHYNEYYAVKLARKLLEEDDDDDENDNKASSSRSRSTSPH